jgi:hypothetical protein
VIEKKVKAAAKFLSAEEEAAIRKQELEKLKTAKEDIPVITATPQQVSSIAGKMTLLYIESPKLISFLNSPQMEMVILRLSITILRMLTTMVLTNLVSLFLQMPSLHKTQIKNLWFHPVNPFI